MEKRSHLGMAGHYTAMSEFLYRGYNVAVPAVDIGDDAYVVKDRMGTMWRLQVKTCDRPIANSATYQISRAQLRAPKVNELFFMFLIRWLDRCRFVLIRRDQLAEIRDRFEQQDRTGRRGRRPQPDASARSDALALRLEWSEADATGWGASLAPYLDRWPETFPINSDGPGSATAADRSQDL